MAGRGGGRGGGGVGGSAKRLVWWVLVAAFAVAVWNGSGHAPEAWKATLVSKSASANAWAHRMAGSLGLPTDGSAPAWSNPVGKTGKPAPHATPTVKTVAGK